MGEMSSLRRGLQQSFINKEQNADKNYQAALLTNEIKEGRKFLSNLLTEVTQP